MTILWKENISSRLIIPFSNSDQSRTFTNINEY